MYKEQLPKYPPKVSKYYCNRLKGSVPSCKVVINLWLAAIKQENHKVAKTTKGKANRWMRTCIVIYHSITIQLPYCQQHISPQKYFHHCMWNTESHPHPCALHILMTSLQLPSMQGGCQWQSMHKKSLKTGNCWDTTNSKCFQHYLR